MSDGMPSTLKLFLPLNSNLDTQMLDKQKIWQKKKKEVKNFKSIFFSSYIKVKIENFSAHQKENFMNFSKLTLLLFIVPFLW